MPLRLPAPHISFTDAGDAAREYATNIQIAELNSLTASLAVIRWKQINGIYRDASGDHYAGYALAIGEIVRERCA